MNRRHCEPFRLRRRRRSSITDRNIYSASKVLKRRRFVTARPQVNQNHRPPLNKRNVIFFAACSDY